MRTTGSITRAPHQTTYLLAITASLVIIFVLDSLTPLGVSVWALYIFPLILSSHIATHRAPFVTATICSILTVAGYLTSPIITDMQTAFPLFNRGIILGVYWIVAVLVVRQRVVTDQLVRVATLEVENRAHLLRQDALRKSADEIYDLYNHAPCGYHSLDPHGAFVAMNDTELSWLGYTRDEIVGVKRFSDLLTPPSKELFHAQFSHLVAEGIVRDLELELIRKDGTIINVLLNATAIRNTDGAFLRSRTTVTDLTTRKRIEEQLAQKTAVLESVLNNIGEGVIVADLQGRHILLNRAVQDILGEDLRHFAFTPTEATGHFEMYLPDQRTPYAAEQLPLAKAIRGESVDQAELFLRSAGRPHGLWLSMTGRPLTDNAGTPTGGVVVFHDATEGRRTRDELERRVHERTEQLTHTNQRLEQELQERRRVEAALRENEERLALFFQHISAPVAMFDRDMRYVSVSQRWLTDFRLGHQDVIGRSHYEVFPEIPERWREIHRRCLQGAVERADEDPFERPDGSVQWIRWEIRPWYTETRGIGGVIIFSEDVTARKQAMAAIQESKERLAGIIGSAMDAIITIDEQQLVTNFNGSAERMFCCNAGEALGQSINRFIPERFRPAHAAHITAFGSTSDTKRQMGILGTIYGFRANGEEFPIEASISQLQAQGKKFYTVILRDISQRKQAEDALEASERHFRELIELIPQLVWTCLPNGYCDYFNPQWVQYTGLPEDQQLGSAWLNQLHPDDREHTASEWEHTVAQGRPFEAEFRIRRADGMYRWFQTRAIPFRDDHDVILKWFGTNTDIHDRKLWEELQGRLGSIIEYSDDAIISKSLNGTVQTWNQGAERMFGYAAEEIIGKSILTLIPSERHQEEAAIMKNIQDGNRFQHFETIRRRKDGSCIDVSLTISPVKNAGGTIIAISKIARDISARKRTEETLRQHNKLIELSHEPILVWDLDSGITEWNRGCTQLYGYTSAEAVGQSSHGLLWTQFPCPFPDILSTLWSTGEWSGEVRHRAKNGNEVIVESSWGLLKTHGRKLVLEANRDITERKKAERSLLRKNKDLETLLHVTSHDLKEPLRSIESFSHLVQERYADRLDEKGQDYLRRVVRAAQRLDRLLTDILNLSRAQRMEPPLEEVDAEAIIGDVLKRLENRSKETGARIKVASPLPRLRVNRIWATQGLYNLVANALKFTQTGQAPDIEIASYYKQDTVTGEQCIGLTVKDRGSGVRPDQRDRIFQLFQRAVGREIEGTGAGLAIVRQVAERHDGQAWVQPREGGGSEFIITFGHGILMPDGRG